MNTDRFLTRVWDKQEKKMIYKYQKFVYDGVWYVFESVTNDAVIASEYNPILGVCQIICLELEDRFVPMQCTGLKDKKDKLIYAGDILRLPPPSDCSKINFPSYEVFFHDNDSCDYHIGFQMNRVRYRGNVVGGSVPNFKPEITRGMEIIGNIHENPELKEQDE